MFRFNYLKNFLVQFSRLKFYSRFKLCESTYFLKLVDLSDEKVSVPTSNFSVGNVDHVLLNIKPFFIYN